MKTSWIVGGSIANLHAHQQATLKAELADSAYNGLSADEAFSRITSAEVSKRLARTRYVGVSGFPTGAPGFPNKVRRADFDAAWNERV